MGSYYEHSKRNVKLSYTMILKERLIFSFLILGE